eukprot:TRINITY_DN74133_c0_g1_i1.p1 TRINITY_DN74133_c0_g1~~TRINITY_DN74133_c0_g1_i1.p1  ORF type:complete len:900 (-),score=210.96 TRINITY_DN74133_c0_g1_i1:96-2795(-)
MPSWGQRSSPQTTDPLLSHAATPGEGGEGGADDAEMDEVVDVSERVFAGAHEIDEDGEHLVVYDPEHARLVKESEQRLQAEANVCRAVLGSVFSCRKPRDVVAGTSSGLKTMAKGVGIGLVSLVAQPYLGAKAGGAKGFMKGVGTGVATCVGSTVVGTVIGTGQIVRGVVNTPGAVVHKARGQIWNPEKRCWEEDWYSLVEEELEVFGQGGAFAESGVVGEGTSASTPGGAAASADVANDTTSGTADIRRPKKRVADTTLYDIVGVPPEATEAEIRRAFYKKSLLWHPDKNPNNPEANAKFQALSDAYRVLSDEDRRKLYDDHGKDTAAAGMPKIEPVVFFAALFGSHHFEPWVGRLRLAQDVDDSLQELIREVAFSKNDEDQAMPVDALMFQKTADRMKQKQREREVRCAVGLVRRLLPVIGTVDEAANEKWEKEQMTEVQRLVKTPCGLELCNLIGWVYTNRSRQFFAGGMLKRAMATVEGKVHLSQSKARLASSVGRTALRVTGIMKTAEKKKSLAAKAEEKAKAQEGGASAAACKDEDEEAPVTTERKEDDHTPGFGPTSSAKAAESTDNNTSNSNSNNVDTNTSNNNDGENINAEAEEDGVGATAAVGAQTGEFFVPGTLVMIRGLQKCTELNDEVGMVVGSDTGKERLLVQILPDGGVKSLRPENLLALDVDAGDAPSPPTSARRGGASTSSTPPPSSGEARYGTEDGQYAPGGEEAEMADAFKDCAPLFHDALFSATALDIEFTLNRVIQKILRDMSVDGSVRRQRAEALLKLGRFLQEPLKEQRQKGRTSPSDSSGTLATETDGASQADQKKDPGKKRSMFSSAIARYKQRAPWRSSTERRSEKARLVEAKRKRLEGALAMMVAGASTEDVDDIIAAHSAMEAEFEKEASV